MPPEKSNRRLGRGLDALFSSAAQSQATEADGPLREIPVSHIAPNPFQPRRDFREEELRELQESLRTNGLLQPVTVRPRREGKGYELVAGERRLRAAAALGWSAIAAVVKELSDRDMLTLALVENLQRYDLNPVEEAEGFERLIKDFGYTQQSVADMVGKDRSTVANVIRILHLPLSVRNFVREGRLTAGQVRPLLGLDNEAQIAALANQIIDQGLSAREVERRVREAPTTKPGKQRQKKKDDRSADVKDLEERLRKHLQTDVTIAVRAGNRGTVTVAFYSADDLERLTAKIGLPDSPQ